MCFLQIPLKFGSWDPKLNCRYPGEPKTSCGGIGVRARVSVFMLHHFRLYVPLTNTLAPRAQVSQLRYTCIQDRG